MSNGQQPQEVTEAKWYYQGPDERVYGTFFSTQVFYAH